MPSTFTTNLGIEKPADGEQDGVWGDIVNENSDILDRAVNGVLSLTLSGTSSTITTTNGVLSNGQYKLLSLVGTPSGTHTITIAPNTAQKIYYVRNTTAQSVILAQGSGGNITLATGESGIIYANGSGASAQVLSLSDYFSMSNVNITGGTAILSSLVAATADINGGTIDGTTVGATTASTGNFTSLVATTADINGGTIDNASVGATTASTGRFTSLVATTADINGGTIDGTTVGATTASTGNFTSATINGGAINGATVGATTASTGNFTSLVATTADINGGTIDGATVGATTASTGNFTSLVATTADINGGTIDGATVGATTAATGRFTSAAADTLTNTAGTRGPTLTKGYVETVFALTGTTPALNPANGTVQTWTLSANSAPTDSVAVGESLTLMIDDGATYAITWPSVVWKTGSGIAPTLNVTGFTAIVLWKVGSVLYGARVGDA